MCERIDGQTNFFYDVFNFRLMENLDKLTRKFTFFQALEN